MKILFLGFTKMKFMPYASFYLDEIDCEKNEVHIVYWNRDLKPEDLSSYSNVKFHEFAVYMEDTIPKYTKIIQFLKYRNFVNSVLKKYNFDMIISLHTLPGLLILDKLNGAYCKKYILDYRDSTFEKNIFFGLLVKKLALNAILVFVSSDAFRKFLPSDNKVEIITSHNILSDSLNHRDERKKSFIKSDKIRIAFWGLLRHTTLNLKIIERLGNDSRFELHYYGRELSLGDIFRNYCRKHGIMNVFLHGEYQSTDRYEFIKKTDIIHNCYCDNNTMLAMGNKYYDGIIFRLPQLCMPGSFMGKRCIERRIGCAFDPNDIDFADKLYNYMTTFDQTDFDNQCDVELNHILEEYNYGKYQIHNLLNS